MLDNYPISSNRNKPVAFAVSVLSVAALAASCGDSRRPSADEPNTTISSETAALSHTTLADYMKSIHDAYLGINNIDRKHYNNTLHSDERLSISSGQTEIVMDPGGGTWTITHNGSLIEIYTLSEPSIVYNGSRYTLGSNDMLETLPSELEKILHEVLEQVSTTYRNVTNSREDQNKFTKVSYFAGYNPEQPKV